MEELTRKAMEWLDWRYSAGVAEGRYRGHEPVFGVGCEYTEPNHALRLARTYSLFRRLGQMQFETLLDVGGSEGYHASLARKLFAAQVVTSDLSVEANRRARELFDLPGVASDAHWLPYADESFEVVLCCEVLEHVADPVAVMCEVFRVARRYAVFSTEQTVGLARVREILLALAGRPHPHGELHWFLPSDFETALGGRLTCERQAVLTDRGAELMAAHQEASEEEVRALVFAMTRLNSSAGPDHGLIAIRAKGEAPLLDTSHPGDEALLEAILTHRVAPGQVAPPEPDRLDPFLQSRLACPLCLTALPAAATGLDCPTCGRRFKVEHGLPRMHLDPGPTEPEAARAHRWPWLTEEGRKLRAMFTAPRIADNRLLCYVLCLELGLLGWRQEASAPALDYLNSEEVRWALLAPLLGEELEHDKPELARPWWDELPATEIEREAMRQLGKNLLKLKTYGDGLSRQITELTWRNEELSQQLGRIYSRWPVRAMLWLKRLLMGKKR